MPRLAQVQADKIATAYRDRYGLGAHFFDLSGQFFKYEKPPEQLIDSLSARMQALQRSISNGEPQVFMLSPRLATWVVPLEHNRTIEGGLVSAPVLIASHTDSSGSPRSLVTPPPALPVNGGAPDATSPTWSQEQIQEAAAFLQKALYEVTGWDPVLMRERWLRVRQREQIGEAIQEDSRSEGGGGAWFAKEQKLLADCRAGDLQSARQILNELLTPIYFTSPDLDLLKAKVLELLTSLSRAALEDNPMLDSIVRTNRTWAERIIGSPDFEGISTALSTVLDELLDTIHLHGLNRTNPKVKKAIDYMRERYREGISLRDVARAVDLSPYRLAHLVKDLTGKTVVQTIHGIQISQAQRLLLRSNMSCTEIAHEVGFVDQSYFIKHFRAAVGTTPLRYRRSTNRSGELASPPPPEAVTSPSATPTVGNRFADSS